MKLLNLGILGIIIMFCISSCSTSYVVSNGNLSATQQGFFKFDEKVIPTPGVHFKNTTALKETSTLELDSEVNTKSFDLNKRIITTDIISLLNTAKSYLGTPYRYGGTTRRGIDCSAFIQQSFESINIEMPRVSAAQSQLGDYVEVENLREGDLVFFNTSGRRISHVGIVENISEEGQVFFIHASSSNGVSISSLTDNYWSKRFRFAKRVL